MRKQKQVVVFDGDEYDAEWPPTSAFECIAWFANKLESIPLEHRSTATIEFGIVIDHEDKPYAHIVINYDRPETNYERAVREEEELRCQEAQREQELKMLAALKAKYER